MDPLTAGGLLAPLFVLMDVFAPRYWRPSTWSKPDLAVLVPCLIVGIGLDYIALRLLDGRAVAIAIAMALITLAFSALWFRGGGSEGRPPPRGRAHRRRTFPRADAVRSLSTCHRCLILPLHPRCERR